jgi:hypothetical protein
MTLTQEQRHYWLCHIQEAHQLTAGLDCRIA